MKYEKSINKIQDHVWLHTIDVSYVLLHTERCVLFDYTQKDVSYVWLNTDVSYVLLHIDRCFFFLINPQKGVSYDWLHTKRSVLRLITHKKMCPMFDYTQKDVSYDWLHTKRCVLFDYRQKDVSYIWLHITRCVLCFITHR